MNISLSQPAKHLLALLGCLSECLPAGLLLLLVVVLLPVLLAFVHSLKIVVPFFSLYCFSTLYYKYCFVRVFLLLLLLLVNVDFIYSCLGYFSSASAALVFGKHLNANAISFVYVSIVNEYIHECVRVRVV